MKRNVLIFGLSLGTILCINMIYMVHICYSRPDLKSNYAAGYVAMIAVFSLIFFGIRNYRNTQLNGEIYFGKAFKTGALIVLISSTMYVLAWLLYYYLFVPDYLDKYIPHVLKETAPSDLAVKTKEMESFREMYKNKLFVILVTYSEIVPGSLMVALISSLILKKRK